MWYITIDYILAKKWLCILKQFLSGCIVFQPQDFDQS